MPDRIIRDELLESDRWIDLPTDTDRLAYVGLRLRTDDFGNMEAGPRRLFRFLHGFTQIKTEEGAAAVLEHLTSADMIRFYKVGAPEREFIHLPRSRPTGSYLVRKCPPSPWCDAEQLLGKHIRSIRNQGLAKNIPVTSLEHDRDVSQGNGKGVEFPAADASEKDRLPDKPKTKDTPAAKGLRRDIWGAYSDAYQDRYGVPPQPSAVFNAAIKRFSVQLPAAECVPVATFYVGHNNQFYVSKGHHLNFLAADAAKLRTEWATDRQITQTEAQQGDRRQGNRGVFQKIIKEIEDEKTND